MRWLGIVCLVAAPGCATVEWHMLAKNNQDRYSGFITRHPQSKYSKVAVNKLGTVDDYREFLAGNPEGTIAKEAERALEKLLQEVTAIDSVLSEFKQMRTINFVTFALDGKAVTKSTEEGDPELVVIVRPRFVHLSTGDHLENNLATICKEILQTIARAGASPSRLPTVVVRVQENVGSTNRWGGIEEFNVRTLYEIAISADALNAPDFPSLDLRQVAYVWTERQGVPINLGIQRK